MTGAYELIANRLGEASPLHRRSRDQMTALYEAWGKEDRASVYRDPASGDGR